MKRKAFQVASLAGWVALAYEIIKVVMQWLTTKPGG